MRRDTFLKSLAAMAAAGALPNLAWAAANVKMMIPANPGGGWDGTGRALGEALRDAKVADSVTFENKGGAAGAIGLARFRHVAAERSRAGSIVTEADREIERQVRAVGTVAADETRVMRPGKETFAPYNMYGVPRIGRIGELGKRGQLLTFGRELKPRSTPNTRKRSRYVGVSADVCLAAW